MTRDYAKHKSKRKKPKNTRFLWLMALFISIAGSITLALTIDISKPYDFNLSKLITKKHSSSKKSIPKIVSKKIISPKFEFYSISSKQKNKDKNRHKLEIAIVNSFARADRLKAELALLGFAANISPIYQQNIQKYCITLGPYSNETTVKKIRQKLKAHKITSTIKTR